MKLIGDTSEEIKKVKTLYYRAFPKNERRSFSELVENRLGSTEIFCFYDGETLVGMACLLNTPTISHIITLQLMSRCVEKDTVQRHWSFCTKAR